MYPLQDAVCCIQVPYHCDLIEALAAAEVAANPHHRQGSSLRILQPEAHTGSAKHHRDSRRNQLPDYI
jgi:hypothetical protein